MKTGTKNKRLSIYFLSGLSFFVVDVVVEVDVAVLVVFVSFESLHSLLLADADFDEQHLLLFE